MEDSKIVSLYQERSVQALEETKKKYERYCYKIAFNILHNHEDSDECVNDTYLRAWNSIPPHCPERLSTYLGKITRNLSLTNLEKKNRNKRNNGQTELAFHELEDCFTSKSQVEDKVEAAFVVEIINNYLKTLGQEARMAFIGRYYYFTSIRNLSKHLGISESKTKTMLYRVRIGLKECLEKEGIYLYE